MASTRENSFIFFFSALQMIQAGKDVETSLDEVIQANPLFGENAAAFKTDCRVNSNGNCAFYDLPTNYS